MLFGLTPFSAVFYPVSVLPAWVRPVSLALPSTHVFEGMRAVLGRFHGGVGDAGWGQPAWGHMAWAVGLNALWLAGAVAVFAWQFRAARERGALITIGE